MTFIYFDSKGEQRCRKVYFVFILIVLTMISDQNVTIDHSKHLVNIMDEGAGISICHFPVFFRTTKN